MLGDGFRGFLRRVPAAAVGFFCVLALGVWAAPSASLAVVGQVTFSIGSSQIEREGFSGRVAKGGSVSPGDVIRTTGNGHVHIHFVDGARVSVRPDSVLHIVEYRYDVGSPAASEVKFYLETGTVREISGLAAESARDRFRLNTPLAAIGVKGTDFLTQVNAQSTVILVNQGAIALSPFDAICQASGSGPCNTALTRELSANMKGMALVYRPSASEPVLQPVNSLKGSDKITPILILERMGATASSTVVADSRSPAVLTDVVAGPVPATPVPATPVPTTPVPTTPVPTTPVPTTPVPATPVPATPVPDVGGGTVAARNSLVWGRWPTNPIPGDAITVSFLDAIQGNQVMVGDGYYFLFRGSNVPDFLSSASGVVSFSLQNGSASYRAPSNEVSAAAINGGSLSIDFAHNTYATALSLSAPAVGAQTMNSSGTIDPRTGIFISASTAEARTAGAVSLDLRQAGYFFNKPVGNGALNGATLWGR
jgi:hypothetical protein